MPPNEQVLKVIQGNNLVGEWVIVGGKTSARWALYPEQTRTGFPYYSPKSCLPSLWSGARLDPKFLLSSVDRWPCLIPLIRNTCAGRCCPVWQNQKLPMGSWKTSWQSLIEGTEGEPAGVVMWEELDSLTAIFVQPHFYFNHISLKWKKYQWLQFAGKQIFLLGGWTILILFIVVPWCKQCLPSASVYWNEGNKLTIATTVSACWI